MARIFGVLCLFVLVSMFAVSCARNKSGIIVLDVPSAETKAGTVDSVSDKEKEKAQKEFQEDNEY